MRTYWLGHSIFYPQPPPPPHKDDGFYQRGVGGGFSFKEATKFPGHWIITIASDPGLFSSNGTNKKVVGRIPVIFGGGGGGVGEVQVLTLLTKSLNCYNAFELFLASSCDHVECPDSLIKAHDLYRHSKWPQKQVKN